MAEENEVRPPYPYYADPTRGRPIFNAFIYVGEPDTDPQIASNQIQVKAIQEDGLAVNISQPIRTGAGGIAMLNGSPVQLQVDGEYSIKVLDHLGVQVYYLPRLIDGMRPTTIVRTQAIPLSIDLPNRFINKNLFDPNISFQSYYDANNPNMDWGLIGSAPFDIENIPVNRIDAAQGNSFIDFGSIV